MFITNDGVKHIYAEDLYKDDTINLATVIDIREPEELKDMKLNGTLHIPMQTLLQYPQKFLSKDQEYYLLCRSGHRSYVLASVLQDEGYQVINVVGGMLVIDELQNQQIF